jgi:hypothetical protein
MRHAEGAAKIPDACQDACAAENRDRSPAGAWW